MAETANTIREKVDPKGTLPEVSFARDPSKKDNERGTRLGESNLIMSGDTQIGTASVNRDLKTKEAWFNGVEIADPDYKGKGYGTAAYLHAVEQAHDRGETFRTHDYTFSPEAAKVWQRFVDVGIAEVIEPMEEVRIVGAEGSRFVGHIQAPPPELHA